MDSIDPNDLDEILQLGTGDDLDTYMDEYVFDANESIGSDGETPLMVAAEAGNTDIVHTLLMMPETDPYVTDDLGRTALFYASDLDTLQEFFDSCEIDINASDNTGITPLHDALDWVKHGRSDVNLEYVQHLVENGAIVDARALNMAIQYNSYNPTVEEFIQREYKQESIRTIKRLRLQAPTLLARGQDAEQRQALEIFLLRMMP